MVCAVDGDLFLLNQLNIIADRGGCGPKIKRRDVSGASRRRYRVGNECDGQSCSGVVHVYCRREQLAKARLLARTETHTKEPSGWQVHATRRQTPSTCSREGPR